MRCADIKTFYQNSSEQLTFFSLRWVWVFKTIPHSYNYSERLPTHAELRKIIVAKFHDSTLNVSGVSFIHQLSKLYFERARLAICVWNEREFLDNRIRVATDLNSPYKISPIPPRIPASHATPISPTPPNSPRTDANFSIEIERLLQSLRERRRDKSKFYSAKRIFNSIRRSFFSRSRELQSLTQSKCARPSINTREKNEEGFNIIIGENRASHARLYKNKKQTEENSFSRNLD